MCTKNGPVIGGVRPQAELEAVLLRIQRSKRVSLGRLVHGENACRAAGRHLVSGRTGWRSSTAPLVISPVNPRLRMPPGFDPSFSQR